MNGKQSYHPCADLFFTAIYGKKFSAVVIIPLFDDSVKFPAILQAPMVKFVLINWAKNIEWYRIVLSEVDAFIYLYFDELRLVSVFSTIVK